jgi:hypothetical protein
MAIINNIISETKDLCCEFSRMIEVKKGRSMVWFGGA